MGEKMTTDAGRPGISAEMVEAGARAMYENIILRRGTQDLRAALEKALAGLRFYAEQPEYKDRFPQLPDCERIPRKGLGVDKFRPGVRARSTLAEIDAALSKGE